MMASDNEKRAALRRRLIVGLGNPGSDYASTRHNAGFLVVDKLANDAGITLNRNKFSCVYGNGRLAATDVLLAQPMAYMNRSGPAVQQLAAYYRISGQDLLVVHDDIDLVFGRIKIKEKGGHGGHNGIKSLINAFGNGDFVRVRIGVGRPESGRDTADHVLEPLQEKGASCIGSHHCTGARCRCDNFERRVPGRHEHFQQQTIQ